MKVWIQELGLTLLLLALATLLLLPFIYVNVHLESNLLSFFGAFLGSLFAFAVSKFGPLLGIMLGKLPLFALIVPVMGYISSMASLPNPWIVTVSSTVVWGLFTTFMRITDRPWRTEWRS